MPQPENYVSHVGDIIYARLVADGEYDEADKAAMAAFNEVETACQVIRHLALTCQPPRDVARRQRAYRLLRHDPEDLPAA